MHQIKFLLSTAKTPICKAAERQKLVTQIKGRALPSLRLRVLAIVFIVALDVGRTQKIADQSRGIDSDGVTVTDLKLDIRTNPGAAPFGLARNLRGV